MEIRSCRAVLIYFSHGDHRGNTAVAADAALKTQFFLMFNFYIHLKAFINPKYREKESSMSSIDTNTSTWGNRGGFSEGNGCWTGITGWRQ